MKLENRLISLEAGSLSPSLVEVLQRRFRQFFSYEARKATDKANGWSELNSEPALFSLSLQEQYRYHLDAMTDSVVDCKTEVKQATKYVKETENVAEKYSAMTVSKNSSDVNMNVGEMPSAAFTAVPTLKSVKKVRNVTLAISH